MKESSMYKGILLIDKSHGITSHDVVDKLRRILKIKKIGHTGTLDPMATGLLVMLVGEYTKRANEFIALDKEYFADITFGKTTETFDAEGIITDVSDTDSLSLEMIKDALSQFMGEFLQEPPMYSAVKVGGEKLYKLARQGKNIFRAPRPVHVYSFKIIEWKNPLLRLIIRCSKGTYIRSIAHNLGQSVGTGAYLSGLRRTLVGNYTIDDAHTLEEIEEAANQDNLQGLFTGINFCKSGIREVQLCHQ